MAEPRARPRQVNTRTFSDESLIGLLTANGANEPHLPETLRVFDEILTDFIIEICHQAAMCASYSRRQKIKADDFKFALRKDKELLGRVLEQLQRDKGLKEERKMMDVDGLAGGAGAVEGLGELVGEGGRGKGKGKGAAGKKRKAANAAEEENWEDMEDEDGEALAAGGKKKPKGNA